MAKLPHRRRPARGVSWRDDQPTIILDTVCVRDRRPILANEAFMESLVECWEEADRFLVGRFVIMPDHIHYFCAPTSAEHDFTRWVMFWKSLVTRRTGIRMQSGEWDTRIRSESHYADRWEYVRWNPVRKALVNDPDAWPFQGEMHRIVWNSGRWSGPVEARQRRPR
ncbi:MAG: hypothetical protein KY459_14825 [Acidobacteria bacterium]|nr:hypothetical protein [Acidobacteriota bacterium]